jgi:dihydropteroate synthase
VHDVAATVDALKVWQAVEQGGISTDIRTPVPKTEQ